MEITVKYFGIIADITQKKEETIFLEGEVNRLKNFQSKLEIIYPKILDINYSLAINKLFANCDNTLKDKDVVALLPPFAGG
jgi:molybdopterin synthase sulfur carrier subunit